jgi:cytoskeletal protein RodZ
MNEPGSNPADEHLPSRSAWRAAARRPRVVAAAASGLLVFGGVVFAVTNDDGPDTAGAGSTQPSATSTSSQAGSTNSPTSSRDEQTTTSPTDSRGTTSTGAPTLTTIPGQTIPTAPPDTSPDTTLPAPKPTSPPAPSTTGPDTRSTIEAYSQEYERYCRTAFGIAPNGILHDPDFIDDTYTVDDCLYWLDPEWGEFFDTAAEAAQGGIDDAISTMEDMTSLSGALCWIDSETEQWGGCWVTPNG